MYFAHCACSLKRLYADRKIFYTHFVQQKIVSYRGLLALAFSSPGSQRLIKKGLHNITVYTVDSCQGDEKDFLILSFVRANTQNAIGFIDNPKRLNVALTRAKYSLIMLGNAKTLKNSNSDIAILIDDARKRGCFFEEDCLETELFHDNNQSHKRQKIRQSSFYKGKATFFQTPEEQSKETVFSVNRHENINNISKQICQL